MVHVGVSSVVKEITIERYFLCTFLFIFIFNFLFIVLYIFLFIFIYFLKVFFAFLCNQLFILLFLNFFVLSRACGHDYCIEDICKRVPRGNRSYLQNKYTKCIRTAINVRNLSKQVNCLKAAGQLLLGTTTSNNAYR